MKNFYGELISEPTITAESNGTFIKFSSGLAIFIGVVTNTSTNYRQSGNIRISDNVQLDISNLHLKSILGVSVSKTNYRNNSGVYGCQYDTYDTSVVYVSFFRGDSGTLENSSASVIVFGIWK